jgi:putative tryptophan/tyrosine transport system substrate-binding protein
MRRREFVAGAVLFTAITPVAAQPVANSRRLAIVDVSNPLSRMYEDSESYYRVLFTELRRLGQIEGQNLTVERTERNRIRQIKPPSRRKWFAAIRM